MSATGLHCLPGLVMAWVVLPYLLVNVWGEDMVTWHEVKVSQATLQPYTPRVLTTHSDLTCAMQATQDPQAHLFCQPVSDPAIITCRLYPIKVGAGHDDSKDGPVQHCWTRHPREDPEFHLANGTCQILENKNGSLTPYQGARAANISFSTLLTHGCVHLHTTDRKAYSEARGFCRAMGGDLYVAGDFQGLVDYLGTLGIHNFWVGARYSAWLDGREITVEEADPGLFKFLKNNLTVDCMKLRSLHGTAAYLLRRADCNSVSRFVCQWNVTYLN